MHQSDVTEPANTSTTGSSKTESSTTNKEGLNPPQNISQATEPAVQGTRQSLYKDCILLVISLK